MAEIIVQEEGSTPSTPGTGKWKLYFKSTGIFIVDDAGTETGPLGEAGVGSGDMLKATYDTDNNDIVDESESVVIECRKGSAGTITKGQPVYVSGYNVGGWVEIELADANNASAMPCVGFAGESITNASTGHLHLSGLLDGLVTDSFNVGDKLYVSDTVGTLTATRPTSTTSLIQTVAIVLRSHVTLGVIMIIGAGRSNALPQFTAADKFWYSDANGTPTEVAITAAGRALLDDANAAAQIATLGLDADIATFALPASTTISAFGATLVDDANAAAALATLGALPIAGGTITGPVNLGENASLELDAALSADGKYSGIVEAGTAGATLAFGDLVYLAVADSRWELTDSDAVATAGPVKIGICVLAAAGDASATLILLWGKVRADGVFPALTIGAPVYVDVTAGDITVTAPSGSADIVRIIGHANTADELFFHPDNTFIELT